MVNISYSVQKTLETSLFTYSLFCLEFVMITNLVKCLPSAWNTYKGVGLWKDQNRGSVDFFFSRNGKFPLAKKL